MSQAAIMVPATNVAVVSRATSAPEWQLHLVDGFDLSCDGRSIPVARSSQKLMAFLALSERPISRGYVSGTLWLDSDNAHANSSLRSALWRTPTIRGTSPVVATATHLTLAANVVVDYRHLVAFSRALLQQHNEPLAKPWTFGELATLDGELLPDWYDDWAILEKERYRQLRLHALDALCVELCAVGRYGEAVHVALTAIAADPLRESAHRRAIEVHLAEGNRVEAIRQFRAYESLLDAELDLRPSSELTRLVEFGHVEQNTHLAGLTRA